MRKKLLHAKSIWHSVIKLSLWKYVIHNTNELNNKLPEKEDGTSPIDRFSQVDVEPNINNNHTFGCTYYPLTNSLQSGGWKPKWKARDTISIKLVPSPRHNVSIVIVLDTQTRIVSPKYHIQFEEFFKTGRPSNGNTQTLYQFQNI